MRDSHDLPLPPRIYPLLNIYATLPKSTTSSLNIPPPFKQLYATFPESTPPSQNRIPPFLTTICNPPTNYPLPEYTPVLYKVTLPESTPSFQYIHPFLQLYMRSSQNVSRPPGIYPTLDMQPSQNPTHPSRICPLLHHYICDTPIIYPSQNIPPFKHLYVTLSVSPLRPKIYPPFKHLNTTLSSSTSQSVILPFLTAICDPPIIHPYHLLYKVTLPESTPSF